MKQRPGLGTRALLVSLMGRDGYATTSPSSATEGPKNSLPLQEATMP
jgi:hypothetical protein